MQIGVTASTRASSRVPFNLDEYYNKYADKQRQYPHPEAKLTSVEVVAGVSKDKYKLLPDVKLAPNVKPTPEQVTPESLRYSLAFQFEDLQGVQEFQMRLFEVEADDAKADNKNRMNNERIAHFYEAYMGANSAAAALDPAKIVPKGTPLTWKSYFDAVAGVFNTGKEGQAIYSDVVVRIKLTRNTGAKNPNSLTMPLGNVIEKVVKEAKTSTLTIESSDAYLTAAKPKGFGAAAGAAAGGFGPTTKAQSDDWGDDV